MASWAAVPALSGFQYSGAERIMEFAAREGTHFWSNGWAWGTCRVRTAAKGGKPAFEVVLTVLHGRLELKEIALQGAGRHSFGKPALLAAGESFQVEIVKPKS